MAVAYPSGAPKMRHSVVMDVSHKPTNIRLDKKCLTFQKIEIVVYIVRDQTGNTKGESITVPLTLCLTGLESALQQLIIFVFICKTD